MSEEKKGKKDNRINSKSNYLIIFIAFFLIVISLLIWRAFLEENSSFIKPLEFIMLISLSFSTAAFFFGVFKGSTAEGEGKLQEFAFKLGGPIVVIPLLVLLYINWVEPNFGENPTGVKNANDSTEAITIPKIDSSEIDVNKPLKQEEKIRNKKITYSFHGKAKLGQLPLEEVKVLVEGNSEETKTLADGSFTLKTGFSPFSDQKRVKIIFDHNGTTKSEFLTITEEEKDYFNILVRYD